MDAPRILLVDDEIALLSLMRRFLTQHGYEVCSCNRGDEAWKRFREPGSRFDLAIVDRSLPDMDGEALLDRMLNTDPRLRAIVCSGTPDSGSFTGDSRVNYVQKPFLPKMLAEAVEAALDPKSATQSS